MKRFNIYISILSIICFALSCDSDSGGPLGPGTSPDAYGSIVVMAVDENENPFEGVLVRINSESGETVFQQITNGGGIARFDSITDGVYGVYAWSFRAIVDDGAPNIPHEIDGVVAAAGDTVRKKFYYPVEPYDVPVYSNAASDVSSQYDLVRLSFPVWGVESTLDGQGDCVLSGIDLRNGGPTVIVDVVMGPFVVDRLMGEWQTDRDGWPYLDLYVKSPPSVEIVSPETGAVFHSGTVEFSCVGEDLDDGILPEDALVWRSSIDGILGTGHTITTNLTAGHHFIYIIATDSDGEKVSDSIAIDVNLETE